jgi:hypothetical protein
MFKKVGSRKTLLSALENTANVRSGEVKTSTYLNKAVFSDIYPAVNRKLNVMMCFCFLGVFLFFFFAASSLFVCLFFALSYFFCY